jgi:hypothetical protein
MPETMTLVQALYEMGEGVAEVIRDTVNPLKARLAALEAKLAAVEERQTDCMVYRGTYSPFTRYARGDTIDRRRNHRDHAGQPAGLPGDDGEDGHRAQGSGSGGGCRPAGAQVTERRPTLITRFAAPPHAAKRSPGAVSPLRDGLLEILPYSVKTGRRVA